MVEYFLKCSEELEGAECLLVMGLRREHAPHKDEPSIPAEAVLQDLTELLLVSLDASLSGEVRQHITKRKQRGVDLVLNRVRHLRHQLPHDLNPFHFLELLELGDLLGDPSIEASEIDECETALAPRRLILPRHCLHCQCKYKVGETSSCLFDYLSSGDSS